MKPTTRTAAWGATTALYFVVTTLAHLEFSLWLVAKRSTIWQDQPVSYTYRDFMLYLLPLIAMAWAAWMVRSARRYGTRMRIAVVCAYWLLWLGCVAAVDRWLTYSVAEYFHYPQYALLTILVAKIIDPDHTRWPVTRLLLITTLLGALDELAQYTWITVSYSNYYDFNDVLVNLLAGTLGVMLYYGFRIPPGAPPPSTSRSRPDRFNAGMVLAVVLLCSWAWSTNRLAITPPTQVPPGGTLVSPNGHNTLYLQRKTDFFGGWQPGIRHGKYHVLPPAWALGYVLLVYLIWGMWASLARGQSSRPPPTHRHPPISPS